jgi:hypothetical protein
VARCYWRLPIAAHSNNRLSSVVNNNDVVDVVYALYVPMVLQLLLVVLLVDHRKILVLKKLREN